MTPQRSTLNLSLTPELGEFIVSLVKSGKYKSASEVIREGLGLLQQQVSSSKVTSKKHQSVEVEERG